MDERARTHGVSDEDFPHAYANPIRVFELQRFTLVIGANQAAIVFEMGVVDGHAAPVIVHVRERGYSWVEEVVLQPSRN